MSQPSLDMPFWEHLEELRWCIIKSISAIILGAIITYYFGDFTHRLVLNSFSAEQIMISSGFNNVHIFSSKIIVDGYIKEFGRKAIWACVIFVSKLLLFASGKSTKGVLFTPNIILTGIK